MSQTRTYLKTLALVPCLILSTVCGELEPLDTTLESEGSPHTLTYILNWHSEDAEFNADSITLTTDLGYQVVIEQGFVVSYSAELVECPSEEEEVIDVPGMGQLIKELFGPRIAWAGHSELDPNPAAIEVSHAENILAQSTAEMGRVTVDPQRYCELHYLVARGERETKGLPESPDIVGMSVYVSGTYQLPDEEMVAFTINTSRAYGLLSDLFPAGSFQDPQAALKLDTGVEDATITITRDLDRIFDGVDFETMTSEQQASQVLKQIVETSTFAVTPGI